MSDFSRHGKAVIERVVEEVLSGPLNGAKSRVSDLKYISFTLYSFYKNYFPPFSTCSSAISTTSVTSGARIAVIRQPLS